MNMFICKFLLLVILISSNVTLHIMDITKNVLLHYIPFPKCTVAGLQDPYEILAMVGFGVGAALVDLTPDFSIDKFHTFCVNNKKTVSENAFLLTN